MEAVILAAGQGSRLSGVAAPFFKPLMVVNGQPLIVDVVRKAWTAGCTVCHVVVAPQNAAPIIDLLEATDLLDHCTFTIQPRPGGPGRAFLLAAARIQTRQVMVLMADNVLRHKDIATIVHTGESARDHVIVGVRKIPSWQEAKRFTVINFDGTVHEGIESDPGPWADGNYTVWCGPLCLPLKKAVHELRMRADGPGPEPELELKLGRYIGGMGELQCIHVEALDIGLPEAFT